MNPADFIHDNIVKQLKAEGFPSDVATSGARVGVDHYRRCSQATRKGRMFDDCLHHARQHAIYQTPKAELKTAKKPRIKGAK